MEGVLSWGKWGDTKSMLKFVLPYGRLQEKLYELFARGSRGFLSRQLQEPIFENCRQYAEGAGSLVATVATVATFATA